MNLHYIIHSTLKFIAEDLVTFRIKIHNGQFGSSSLYLNFYNGLLFCRGDAEILYTTHRWSHTTKETHIPIVTYNQGHTHKHIHRYSHTFKDTHADSHIYSHVDIHRSSHMQTSRLQSHTHTQTHTSKPHTLSSKQLVTVKETHINSHAHIYKYVGMVGVLW